MKSRSGRVFSFISTLLPLLIGGTLIYGSFFNATIGEHIAAALKTPIIFGALGFVLIVSVAFRWLGGCGGKKESFIDFQSEDGSVGISTKAIQDFIERVGKEFAAVKSIKSQLKQEKGGLDIAMNVKVLAGNKIPELSQMLQQRVRESVRESLGLEEVRNITIKVQEIVGDPSRVSAVSESPVE